MPFLKGGASKEWTFLISVEFIDRAETLIIV